MNVNLSLLKNHKQNFDKLSFTFLGLIGLEDKVFVKKNSTYKYQFGKKNK
jgi:hypothetical protein